MRREALIVSLGAILAIVSCDQPSYSAQPIESPQNGAASAQLAEQARRGDSSPGNGLWGVPEAEDEASHRGIDFIAFNRTGQTLTALAIRPDEGPLAPGAPQNPWSANVLTQRELPDGQRAAAHYEADIELCRWQVRATFSDRQTRDYPAVNLCDAIRVDLR